MATRQVTFDVTLRLHVWAVVRKDIANTSVLSLWATKPLAEREAAERGPKHTVEQWKVNTAWWPSGRASTAHQGQSDRLPIPVLDARPTGESNSSDAS